MTNINFPLFHGTSSIFLDKIQELGLGGFNPIEFYKVIDLLKELEILADAHFGDSSEWTDLTGNSYATQYFVSKITSQKSRHWQHGEVFLTGDKYMAFRYSKNKFGSEAISLTFSLFELLKKNNVNINQSIFDLYANFFELTLKEHSPIVFKIENLSINYLKCGEKGEKIEDLLENRENLINKIKSKYDEDVADDFIREHGGPNFRLLKAIPFSKIEQVY
jgi:hypothetical protein